MQEQYLLFEIILVTVATFISIAVGIMSFFKMYRQFSKSLFNCILAIAGSVLIALVTFCIIATIFVLIRGRWCEGCQEYH